MRNVFHPSLVIFMLAAYASFHSGQAFQDALDRARASALCRDLEHLISRRDAGDPIDHLPSGRSVEVRASPECARDLAVIAGAIQGK